MMRFATESCFCLQMGGDQQPARWFYIRAGGGKGSAAAPEPGIKGTRGRLTSAHVEMDCNRRPVPRMGSSFGDPMRRSGLVMTPSPAERRQNQAVTVRGRTAHNCIGVVKRAGSSRPLAEMAARRGWRTCLSGDGCSIRKNPRAASLPCSSAHHWHAASHERAPAIDFWCCCCCSTRLVEAAPTWVWVNIKGA